MCLFYEEERKREDLKLKQRSLRKREKEIGFQIDVGSSVTKRKQSLTQRIIEPVTTSLFASKKMGAQKCQIKRVLPLLFTRDDGQNNQHETSVK